MVNSWSPLAKELSLLRWKWFGAAWLAHSSWCPAQVRSVTARFEQRLATRLEVVSNLAIETLSDGVLIPLMGLTDAIGVLGSRRMARICRFA